MVAEHDFGSVTSLNLRVGTCSSPAHNYYTFEMEKLVKMIKKTVLGAFTFKTSQAYSYAANVVETAPLEKRAKADY